GLSGKIMKKPLRSHLLSQVPGIDHAFPSIGMEIPPIHAQAEQDLAKWRVDFDARRPLWKQVHSAVCSEVSHASQNCGDVDSLWTRARGIPIAANSADCVPILLSRRDGTAVASAHAGWRGTQAGILRRLWEKLVASGENPKDWVAAI